MADRVDVIHCCKRGEQALSAIAHGLNGDLERTPKVTIFLHDGDFTFAKGKVTTFATFMVSYNSCSGSVTFWQNAIHPIQRQT